MSGTNERRQNLASPPSALRTSSSVVYLVQRALYEKHNSRHRFMDDRYNYMPNNSFGDFLREKRAALRLSLRRFAEAAALDPGNASRLERGRATPPESEEVLDRIAHALELPDGSADRQHLFDLAAAAKGRIPHDLLSDEDVAARLPVLFRTLRSKPLSPEQLDKLIDSIRRA